MQQVSKNNWDGIRSELRKASCKDPKYKNCFFGPKRTSTPPQGDYISNINSDQVNDGSY